MLSACTMSLEVVRAMEEGYRLGLECLDDLLDRFRDYHQGKVKVTMTELRRSYELLIMKVLSVLQDEDQKLASAIVSSREAIWALLADPKKFATLQS